MGSIFMVINSVAFSSISFAMHHELTSSTNGCSEFAGNYSFALPCTVQLSAYFVMVQPFTSTSLI